MQNQPSNEASFSAPVCHICKSQNESLRAVSYPFVFSAVFMTFQRAFAGVYCAKHQRRYHLLASLITSTVGWLGIPFGFILTPLTLINLAKGGIIHVQESFRVLSLVADQKILLGDTHGAIRCLEECLKLQDSPLIREKLSRLYQQQNLVTDRTISYSVWQLIAIPSLLILSVIVGLVIGSFDTLVIFSMSPLFGKDVSIIVAILSWLPTVLFLFIGILIVRALLKWSLNRLTNTPILLGSLLNFTATSFLFYGILEGQSILRNIQALFTFYSISAHDGIFALRSILAHGGIDRLINELNRGDTPSIIFVILFLAAICLSLYVGIELVTQISQGQYRILQVHQSHSTEFGGSSIFSGTIYGLLLLMIGITTAVMYPGSYVNIEMVYQEINSGMTQLDMNDPHKAMEYFRQISRAWPNSVTSHTYIGLGYYSLDKLDEALQELDSSIKLDAASAVTHLFRANVVAAQGKFAEAVKEFESISNAQPEWGVPHAYLAVLHYNLDEADLAQEEIEKAIQYQKEDAQTISSIGSFYLITLDFKKAEEFFLKAAKASNDPQDYLALARIYANQNQTEKAQNVINEADKLGADRVNIYLAKSDLAVSQNDMAAAEKLLKDALDEFPNESELWSEVSFIHYQQGEIDSALSDAMKAVELNPYNSVAYVELAFAYEKQGKKSEALMTAQKGVSLYPKYDRAHYILALSYMDNSMNTEAIQEFETFLDLYWDRPFAQEYKKNAEAFIAQLK